MDSGENAALNKEDAEQGVQDFKEMLEKLIPPEKVELVDAYDNRHTVRSTLPARRQIIVLRHFEKLMAMGIDADAANMGPADIMRFLIDLASNEEVLDVLCDAFEAAHPKLVAVARESAKAEGDDVTHVADLFAAEEIVGGLVPFCIRLATKLLGVVTTVAPALGESE